MTIVARFFRIRGYLAENWDHKQKTLEDLASEIEKAIIPAYILGLQYYTCKDCGNWCPFGAGL